MQTVERKPVILGLRQEAPRQLHDLVRGHQLAAGDVLRGRGHVAGPVGVRLVADRRLAERLAQPARRLDIESPRQEGRRLIQWSMLRKPLPQQTALEIVTLEGLVPKDHLVRKIDGVIDFSFFFGRVAGLAAA